MAGAGMTQEWFTAAEMAALMGVSHQRLNQIVEERSWRARDAMRSDSNPNGTWKRGGGKNLYHLSLLPAPIRAKLAAQAAAPAAPDADRKAAKERLARDLAWSQYEKASDTAKDRAKRKLAALQAVGQLLLTGMSKDAAVRLIGAEQGFSAASYYGWEARVAGVAREDRLAYLMDRYTGRTADTDTCTPAAWDFLLADYLRPEALARPFEVCYRAMAGVAKAKGWTIPSCRTLARRLERDVPLVVRVLKREGIDALKRMFPAQERDRSAFHAMEAINMDGHVFDVFVRWPDGTIGRPCFLGIQDLYSNLMVGWRVDRSENKELVRLAIGDMVQRWGIPDYVYLDNGRSFASKWISGGSATRYRFKIKEEEPLGLLTELDVKITFVTPYHGQAKPIERAWKDFCATIATDPRFAGAYTGNSPTNKPDNYGETAVPLDEFLKVVAWGVHEYNSRPKRETAVCGGKLSFQQAFDASYAQAPIRKATQQQYRLWLLAAEGVTARKVDGSVHIEGNRYWAEFLSQHRGEKLVVRFDPQDLHADVHIYSLSGAYLGSAQCVEAAGFADVEAGRAHARARNAWLKAVKDMAKAEQRMTIQEVAALMPDVPEVPAQTVPASVIRPMFGSVGNAAIKADPVTDDQEQVLTNFSRAVAQLRLVENE